MAHQRIGAAAALFFAILPAGATAQTAVVEQPPNAAFKRVVAPGRKLWNVSLLQLAAANALDVQSSWGKRELNGLLAGGDGRFGARGALVKTSLTGGMAVLERVAMRRNPSRKLCRILTIANFAAGAAFWSVAARNFSVPKARVDGR